VTVTQDGRHPGQKVLDWRIHLGHTDNVCNGAFGGDDATQSVGVLFTKLFKQDEAKLAQ
jgi:hypothetical protein